VLNSVPAGYEGAILAAITESSEDAILTKDLDGVIWSWNSAAERLYGYTSDEVVGRSISMIVPPDRRDELARMLERLRDEQRVERYETVRVAKDGRRIDVALTVWPIRDANGQVAGATAIARDLTARNRADAALRTSELRWQAVIDAAVDGIIVIDSHGRIEGFNPAAERLFGYSQQEVLGRNVNILMPSPYHEQHDGYIARYFATGEKKIIGIGREVVGLRKDGTTFPVHLAVGEIAGTGERKFTGILHDLSGRVRIEQQLREQTALARLGEMAAVIAHEVKNPLAGVRGAIQVIGSRLPKESKDAAMVKEIVARIDGLNGLVKDLLLFSRPPHPKPVPVDVAALLTATGELLNSDPALKDVRVDVQGSAPLVVADADLLKIVFENLMANSAHAMKGRGTIRAALSVVDGDCQIEVRDEGPGIGADVLEKIFTPFFTTKARGSGLGLPTAKRLIEAHQGTIGITSPAGGGAVVTIRLPLQAAPV
jgi:two-component system, LuxR family, sensor kinase FixL